MNADTALDLMTRMLWTGFMVSGPILIVTLIVGVVIGILQVATQLQEMTLSYIPKLLAVGATLLLLGSWMLLQLTGFGREMLLLIPQMN